MTTYTRICVRDYTLSAQNGDTLTLTRGKEYITSGERDGLVTVFSSFWVKVPVDLFAGEESFTKDAPDPMTALRAENAALRVVAEAAQNLLTAIPWMESWAKLIDEDAARIEAMTDHYRPQQEAYMKLRTALGSLESGASPAIPNTQESGS